MSNQETINKMRENILGNGSNYIGTKPVYCDLEDSCKLLKVVSDQYNAVVRQNQSLQKEVLWQQDQMQKDNDYLIKLEEANMLYEQDIETLKRQVDALQDELEKYKRATKTIDKLTQEEISHEL